MRSPPRRAERLLAPRALPMAKPAGAGREVACGLPALPMANPAGARGEAACGTRAAVGEAGRRARRRYMRVPRCQWRSRPARAERLSAGPAPPMAKLAPSRGAGALGSHAARGDSWRSSAARCSTLPKPSTDLGPNPTHLSVPRSRSGVGVHVVCRAARGRAADRRRVAPRGTRLSEKRAAVTQRTEFSKSCRSGGGHATNGIF